MVWCCLLSEENNQSVYLLICSEAEVVSVKTILMFGEATANCLQVHKETKHTAMDVNLLWQDHTNNSQPLLGARFIMMSTTTFHIEGTER